MNVNVIRVECNVTRVQQRQKRAYDTRIFAERASMI